MIFILNIFLQLYKNQNKITFVSNNTELKNKYHIKQRKWGDENLCCSLLFVSYWQKAS